MRPLRLVVHAGPDRGRSVALGANPLTIGRGADQGLQLSDAAVSRHHLSVRADRGTGGLEIVEVTGVNPCWTLREGQRVELHRGDRVPAGSALTLGATTLVVQADAAPAAGAGPGATAPAGRRTFELDAEQLLGASAARPSESPLAALAALGDRLARCGSLQAIYRTATDWALVALPATRALILTPDGSDVLGAASAGRVGDLGLSSALLGRVLAERRAFLLADVLAEPELADRRSVQLRGIVGAAAAPVEGLILYAEWGPAEAARARHDEHALLLLVCAAQLVRALAESAEERRHLAAAARARPGAPAPARLVGTAPAMRRLQIFLEKVAAANSTVLLLGESGTGKELAASTIHALSGRSGGPFVAINCASIPEQLLESELFGHEKGAFTGAVSQHDGVFVRAHGGTLFMDEVGELSPAAQARLLRVLENRTLLRVGGSREISVDVRVVAATHRDLAAMVQAGRFREDLLYRLSVIQTNLPPLRERQSDIPALVEHFAASLGESIGRRIDGIAPAAMDALVRYRWPGNVRELRNVVERALVLGDGPILDVDDLPPELARAACLPATQPPPPTSEAAVRTLAALERDAIAQALAVTQGNKARAAALLGIDRTTLYRKLKDLGL